MTEHYNLILRVVLNLAIYKMLCVDVMDEETIDEVVVKQQIVDGKNDLKEKMQALIALL